MGRYCVTPVSISRTVSVVIEGSPKEPRYGGPGGSRTPKAFAAVLQTVGLATCPLPTQRRRIDLAIGYRTRFRSGTRGAPGDNGRVTRGYAKYVLGVMVAINFLNYMDRYVGA